MKSLVYRLESFSNVNKGNPMGLVVGISIFGAIPCMMLDMDLVADMSAGLWDFVWSCGSGFGVLRSTGQKLSVSS